MAAKAAAEPVAVTLDAPVTVSGNAEFTVPVNISQVNKLNAANFRVTFDPSLIDLDSVTDGTIGSTTIKVDGFKEVQPGVCNVVIFLGGINEANGSGNLAVLHFRALNQAGVTDVDLTKGVLSSSLATEIEATWIGSMITVTVIGGTTSGGEGGGGGGSGGGGSNGKTTASLRGSSSAEGVVWENIHLVSMDTKATLDIAYGTKCVNVNGYALTSVSITQVTSPDAAQSGVIIIGTVYELGPGGASFDPPVTLTIYYNEASLPANTQESDLSISIWDAGSRTYKSIDYEVDIGTNTITASISHFSRYTIIAVPFVTPILKPTPAPTQTIKPTPTPTAVPAPAPSPSPTPVPTATQAPTTPAISTPSPALTTPVAALPIEQTGTKWLLIFGFIGAVVVVGLLVYIFIRRRRASE
jgi:LPXTG-motif cell wall-anchored protein